MVIGAIYTAVMFVGINNSATVQPIVLIERTVLYRERAAGMYSAMPYAIPQASSKRRRASPIANSLLFPLQPWKNDHAIAGRTTSPPSHFAASGVRLQGYSPRIGTTTLKQGSPSQFQACVFRNTRRGLERR